MRLLRFWPAALALLALSACATAPGRRDAAADVAVRLLQHVRDGDGTAACALLAPGTADAVAKSAGKACADAIGDEHLPGPGAVTGVDIDGQWAKVALSAADGDGTVFLAMFPGGWRVAAAGCRSRGQRPYDCAVQGG
ncbi:hypothetical protein [Dactylosporangium sp. CA-139066]|uniref:hypothetical protein n=1 Tax=Dactylosporangium sp. CA-139066 TaxID=3239930 RepID=UPI003D8C0694